MAIRNVETLGDAARARLQLYAHCRNYLCRHAWLVDIHYVMNHVGAAHFLRPVLGRPHFSERMRCPECGAVGVTIEEGERADKQPMYGALHIAIEDWDDRDRQLFKVLARFGNIEMAWAAYERALAIYPTRRLKMTDRAFVIVDSKLRVIRGGKP